MIEFTEWLPDLGGYNNPGLTIADNVIKTGNGFIPMPRFEDVSAPKINTVPRYAEGAIYLLGGAKTPMIFWGTANRLHRIIDPMGKTQAPVLTDVSRDAGYTDIRDTDFRWDFAVFENKVFAVNGGANVLQVCHTSPVVSNRFENQVVSEGEPMRAQFVARVKDSLVLGREDPAIEGGRSTRKLKWSGVARPDRWEIGRNSSDEKYMPSPIQGVYGGDTGIIACTDSIWRMDWTGYPRPFRFEQISKTGSASKNSGVLYDRYFWYYSAGGFMEISDYSTSRPIGREKVDRFVKNYNLQFMSGAYDPQFDRVMWLVGGDSKFAYNQGIIVYDRVTDTWTFSTQVFQMLIGEPVDALNPEIWGTGQDGAMWPLTRKNLPPFSRLITGEFGGNRRIIINKIRPYISSQTGNYDITIQVGSRNSILDPVVWGPEYGLDNDGNALVRAEGAYHRISFTMTPENASDATKFFRAVGYDIEPDPFKPTGKR